MQQMTAEIAHQLGCREMGIYRYDSSTESAESLNGRLDGIIAGINPGDIVICQFPTGNGLRFEWELINRLKAYQSRIAIFIHNLELTINENGQFIQHEIIELYNQAEVLGVSSFAMRQLFLDNGIRENMKFIVQEIWDYKTNINLSKIPVFREEIHFIDGRNFEGMNDWNCELLLKLYTTLENQKENLCGMGEMDTNELFFELSKGGFGLVWYRDEYEHQWMEYNASVSLSRYLSAGIPVIVPSGISNQMLIEENHLGLIVNSLNEASETIKAMSETEYKAYTQSIEQFAPSLRNGYYTKKALIDIISAFFRKDIDRVFIQKIVYELEEFSFVSTVLNESYGGQLALSWEFKGRADGFLVYDMFERLVYETKNIHQHYLMIREYGKESGFIVKAYVDTMKGRLIVAKSAMTYMYIRTFNKPEVSLIIPAYNAENYIVRSIDTVLAQSFLDLEIIIVDDGSTDTTPDIIDWYAGKYSNIMAIHQKNGGTPAARNAGINYANGEYIGFMDNDDMIRPDMITRLYNAIRKNNCDIAVTSVYQITDNGYERFMCYPIETDISLTIDEFFKMHFLKGCMFAVIVWNKLYRASLVKNYLFPVLLYDDEAWTPYILSYAENICYLNDCLYEYDRCIRNNTQIDEWINRPKDELFKIHKKTIMFYLKNGNHKRRGLLKQLAKRQLYEMGDAYDYEEYKKLWEQIEETF